MFSMTVEDVFVIRGRGIVATGRIAAGTVRKGDEVRVNGGMALRVDGIEAFRKILDQANAGDNVGLLFRKIEKSQVNPGDVLSAPSIV